MSQGGRILRALSRIGYPKVGELEGDTLEWLFDCNSLVPFLEWFCDNIHTSNVVSDEDLQRFDELHSSSAYILEKEQVDKTLSMLLNDEDECSTEALRNEVRTLAKEVELINQRLQKLVFQRNKLSLHQSSLGYKISKLNDVERQNKQKYKASLESCQADNKEMNSSLEQLGRSVSDLTALYAESEGDQERNLLSQLHYDSYHFSEETFTGELTAYTRKQFFEGIADMVGREEKSRYELLEISDPTSLLVRGENDEVNLGDCQELSRLQSVYASSESIRIQNTVNAKGLIAAVEAATEKAKNFTWETYPPDTDKIGAKLLEVQKALSKLKMEIRDLTERALPELVQELGELQAISILKGDYNLKIARQDYFTSKQDQVITQLLLQRSRNEFLAMALEVEARKCRDSHRMFSALNATLRETVKNREARTAIMEEHAHHSARHTRATIDSRDHFMERLYAVLEKPAEKDGEEQKTKEMFLAYNQLLELSRKLAVQLETLDVSLSSSSSEQDDAWKQLENHIQFCMKTVYGQSATTGGLPQLSPQRIFHGISQLDEVLATLEHSIKDIIKDCEAKKKVLRSDSLKAMERELFVYFFTDPARLKRAIAELSARVDAQIVSMKQ